MAKYLKKFETQAAYEEEESSLILPNVSFVDDGIHGWIPSSCAVYNPTLFSLGSTTVNIVGGTLSHQLSSFSETINLRAHG